MIGLGGVNKPSRLDAVDCLIQGAMEKSILHIKLVNRPGARQSQSENHPNGGWLDNWTEGFIIVNAWPLCEPTKDPTSFVVVKRAIGLELVTKNPLAGDEVDARRVRHQGPGVIVLQSIKLGLHSLTPGQVRERCVDG
jgi:hypothetical protein